MSDANGVSATKREELTKAMEAERQEREKECEKEILPILAKWNCEIASAPIILRDGRISSVGGIRAK